MIALGWMTGLLCALFHSLCYLASKRHTLRHPGASTDLLLQGHLLMMVGAIPIMIFLWPSPFPPLPGLLLFLFGSSLFYAGGQWFMIEAMRLTEPSRVSPLLGIKVIIMGIVATTLMGHNLTAGQWGGLALCTLGAISLGKSGGTLSKAAAFRILLAAICYVCSDSCIERLVHHHVKQGMPVFDAAIFSLGLTYGFLGLIAGLFAIRDQTRSEKKPFPFRDVAPFALFWLLAMAMYYITLGLVGPVLGVALQSTRGIVSICLGALVAKRQHQSGIEQHLEPKVFLLRLLAGLFMFGGIILYTQLGLKSRPCD